MKWTKWAFINTKGQGHLLFWVLGSVDSVVLKSLSKKRKNNNKKRWADWNQIAYIASMGLGSQSLFMGSDYLAKMAVMPIYDKKDLKFIISGTERPRTLVWSTWGSGSTWFIQMMALHWLWPILQQGQFRSLRPLYGKRQNSEYLAHQRKGSRAAYRIDSDSLSIFVGVIVVNT